MDLHKNVLNTHPCSFAASKPALLPAVTTTKNHVTLSSQLFRERCISNKIKGFHGIEDLGWNTGRWRVRGYAGLIQVSSVSRKKRSVIIGQAYRIKWADGSGQTVSKQLIVQELVNITLNHPNVCRGEVAADQPTQSAVHRSH